MSESLLLGDLVFELRRSARRKTVGITVERDGRLVLTAPVDCPLEQVERIAAEKRLWIYTKLAWKDVLCQANSPREFVSGEGFSYLGRTYRLLLVDPHPADAAVPALRLHHGRFMLRRDERHRAREHFVAWYIERGDVWLWRRVDLLAHRIGVESPRVVVRDLGFRWGSCGPTGVLNFHWRLLQMPPRIIEYVVAHELVHLHEPNHSSEFWRRLERAVPDFAARKQWLAEHGSGF